jgi:hypothetical protein
MNRRVLKKFVPALVLLAAGVIGLATVPTASAVVGTPDSVTVPVERQPTNPPAVDRPAPAGSVPSLSTVPGRAPKLLDDTPGGLQPPQGGCGECF